MCCISLHFLTNTYTYLLISVNNIFLYQVLEAITTKNCQEKFHLESLETLGDSFLKYAIGQHLFRTFQNDHEGLLSLKKDRIVSNAALSRLGCEHQISVISS